MTARGAPTLRTERLVLRPRGVDDAVVTHELWSERDPRVPTHRRIDADGRPTVEDVAEQIRREERDPRSDWFMVEVASTGEVVGYCGLVPGDPEADDERELVYELLRRSHGRGYATEAGAAVVAWAAAGHLRLRAGVRAWNVPSRRVLHKLGFHETGVAEVDPVHGDSLLTVRESR